jgi:hypothetical protein
MNQTDRLGKGNMCVQWAELCKKWKSGFCLGSDVPQTDKAKIKIITFIVKSFSWCLF